MLQLTGAEKLLIVAICTALLLVTILVTVCVVSPVCWLHDCIFRDKKSRKKLSQLQAEYGTAEHTPQFKLTVSPQRTVDSGSPVRVSLPDITGFALKRKHTQDSTYSSMSTSSRGEASLSNYSEISMDAPVNGTDSDVNYGQVTFGLRYKQEEGKETAQLIIVLKEAQDLPPRPYGGTCDPYVTVQVLKDRGRRRRSKQAVVPMYEFRSSTKKKTQHPLFKETFVVELSPSELRDCRMKVIVADSERFANDTEFGQVVVTLSELELEENGEEQVFTFDLAEPRQDCGEILFSLSYLPTAERLTFNIVKGNNLRCPMEDVETFAPCVRVLLFRNGKLVKKKKTSVRPGTVCPVFNEMLTFDLPPAELSHVVFLVVVSHRDPQDTVSSPESPTTPPSGRKGDRHIGKVVIGAGSKGTPLHHWNAMRQAPRKQVAQWHTLR